MTRVFRKFITLMWLCSGGLVLIGTLIPGEQVRSKLDQERNGIFQSEYVTLSVGPIKLATIDSFSECYLIQIAISDSSLLESGRLVQDPSRPACEDLLLSLSLPKESLKFEDYSRFWNWQALGVRPLIVAFGLENTKFLVFGIVLVLVVITMILMKSRLDFLIFFSISLVLLCISDLLFSSFSLALGLQNLFGLLTVIFALLSQQVNRKIQIALFLMGFMTASLTHLFYPLFFFYLIALQNTFWRESHQRIIRKERWSPEWLFLGGAVFSYFLRFLTSLLIESESFYGAVSSRGTQSYTQVLYGFWNSFYLQIEAYPIRFFGLILAAALVGAFYTKVHYQSTDAYSDFTPNLTIQALPFIFWALVLGGHHTHGWAFMTYLMATLYLVLHFIVERSGAK